jgi:hypothetical protein
VGGGRKLDAKGRPKYEHHVRLYDWLIGPLLELCTGNEIKALIFIAKFDFGDNNGRIHMSERRLSEGISVDRKTARKLLNGLERKGFIACTSKGSFNAKRSPASEWRLTWKSWPDRSQGPTNEYRRVLKEKGRGEKLPIAGGEIPPRAARERSTGGEISPVSNAERQKTAKSDRGETGPLTLASGEAAPVTLIRELVSAWWRTAQPKDRLRLASQHGLQIGELISFIQGQDLPFPKLVAIRSSIRSDRAAA